MRTATLTAFVVAVAVGRAAHAQAEPVMPMDLRAGLLARFDESTTKLVQLAEAIPADKFAWRPAPGVRSVSEVLVHVALGNYYTGRAAGVKPPIDLQPNYQATVTDKVHVVTFVKRANAHLRAALEHLTENDLQHPTTTFGQQTTYGNVYLFGVAHVHEHLGQLIAYARMNDVVPPWSAGH